jgi:hypothetical protein
MEVPDDDVPTIVIPSTKVATKEERIRASNQKRKGTDQESKTSQRAPTKNSEFEAKKSQQEPKKSRATKSAFVTNESIVVMSNKKAMNTVRESKVQTI